MPTLAKLIEVETLGSLGKGCRLFIDGQEFPWHVNEEIAVNLQRGDLSRLAISIPAEKVVVVEASDAPSESS